MRKLILIVLFLLLASPTFADVLMGGGLFEPDGPSTGLLTEDSNFLITEDGNFLIQE